MQAWSQHANLQFGEAANMNEADIIVSFENQHHPEIDNDPMDGRIAGHAVPPGPGKGGDVHIRDDISWDFNVMYNQQPVAGSYNFYAVFLHELGHALGLHHSEFEEATMNAGYNKHMGVIFQDDIDGIQSLFGKRYNY